MQRAARHHFCSPEAAEWDRCIPGLLGRQDRHMEDSCCLTVPPPSVSFLECSVHPIRSVFVAICGNVSVEFTSPHGGQLLPHSFPPPPSPFLNAPCIPSGMCLSPFAAMFLWSSLRHMEDSCCLTVSPPSVSFLECSVHPVRPVFVAICGHVSVEFIAPHGGQLPHSFFSPYFLL